MYKEKSFAAVEQKLAGQYHSLVLLYSIIKCFPHLLVQQLLKGTTYGAFLFGSRVKGLPVRLTSNWDIATTGPERVDPILFMDMEEAIERANFIHEVDILILQQFPRLLEKKYKLTRNR